jgi:tetratricopeptide (TPR) repeat protein
VSLLPTALVGPAGRVGLLAALLASLLLASAGCTLTVDGETVFEVSDFLNFAKADARSETETTESDELTQRYKMTQKELDLWNSPDFQKRMAQSYLAVSDVEPPMTGTEKEKHQEVLTLIREGKMPEAVELLKRLRGPAASAAFDYLLGNLYRRDEQIDQAVEAYKTAIDKFKTYRSAWQNLGIVQFQLAFYDQAAKSLQRAVELGANDSAIYGMMGYAYASEGEYLSAESALRLAILLDPKTKEWKIGLARSFLAQKRYAESIALFDQLIKEDPGNAKLWMDQAQGYLRQGKLAAAAENYEFVDQLGGSTLASLTALGDIYVNEKLYELAKDAYVRAMKLASVPEAGNQEAADNALEQRKGNTRRIVRAAQVMVSRGALDVTEELVEALQKYRAQDLGKEQEMELMRIEARIAMARGAQDEQARILEDIVRLEPTDGQAMLQLGRYEAMKDNNEKATFWFERAAKIEGFEAKAKVQHGQLLVREKKYEEALPLLRSAQEIEYRENVQEYIKQVEQVAKSR